MVSNAPEGELSTALAGGLMVFLTIAGLFGGLAYLAWRPSLSVTATTLVVRPAIGRRREIPISQVAGVEITYMGTGAIIAASTGGLLGAVVASALVRNDSHPTPPKGRPVYGHVWPRGAKKGIPVPLRSFGPKASARWAGVLTARGIPIRYQG